MFLDTFLKKKNNTHKNNVDKNKIKPTYKTHLFTQKPFSYCRNKNRYYHQQIKQFYQFTIPPHSRVLQIGCKDGSVLHAINPSYGVGIDTNKDALMQAQKTYPQHTFYYGTLTALPKQTFDYILLSQITMEIDDIQDFLEQLHAYCHPKSRIVIDSYSHLWEPVLWIAQKCGLKRPTRIKQWISQHDFNNLLTLANFTPIKTKSFILFPLYIPLLSTLLNRIIIHIPLMKHLCLMRAIVACPRTQPAHADTVRVSVIIPCKNEAGNIENAVKRTPSMGAHTELIFISGASKDNTRNEIERVIQKYTNKNITHCYQEGTGKGNAVQKGFAHATGDIVMILDADLTMPPEELSKFFNALINRHGDCINGSRLVYGMESGAMRFLNLVANWFFAHLFSWILEQRIKDTLCGTKALWKDDYEKIARHRNFFGNFDPFGDFDLLFGAAKLNLKIIDMPIHYKNRTYGSTQIRRFYHGFILLWMSFIGIKKFKLN